MTGDKYRVGNDKCLRIRDGKVVENVMKHNTVCATIQNIANEPASTA